MNAVARELTASRPWVSIDNGDALTLPYPDATFDAAVSTQVYEYVADIPTALAELRRVLRPGGRTLILDTDWDSVVWHAADRERHHRIMAAWEEHLVHPHLPPALPGHLRRAGFTVTGRPLIPLFNPTYEPNTYSALTMDSSRIRQRTAGLTAEDIDGWPPTCDRAAKTTTTCSASTATASSPSLSSRPGHRGPDARPACALDEEVGRRAHGRVAERCCGSRCMYASAGGRRAPT